MDIELECTNPQVPAMVEDARLRWKAEQARKRRDSGKMVMTGEIGQLYINGGKVMVALSLAAFDRMRQLSSADDVQGVSQLVLNGNCILADSGTKARLIGRPKIGVVEVRITEGQFRGQSGFVDTEFLKPL